MRLFLYLVVDLVLALSPTHARQLPTLTSIKPGTISPTSTPSLTRTAIGVSVPTSEGKAADQVDFFLSSDLRKTLQNSLDNECQVVEPSRCAEFLHSALQYALVIPDGDLQSPLLRSTPYLSAIAAGSITWEICYRSQFDSVKVSDQYSFESSQLLQISDPSTLVMQAENVTATLISDPVGFSNNLKIRDDTQNYAIVPHFSPKLSDSVPNIVAAQFERLAFEGRMLQAGIKLNSILSDKWVELWTADLSPAQLNTVKGDAVVEKVFKNAKIQDEEIESDAELDNPQLPKLRKMRRRLEDDRNSSYAEMPAERMSLVKKSTDIPNWSTQKNAHNDLHTLSDLKAEIGKDGDYDYVSSGGAGSTIYVVEKHPFVISHPEIGLSPADVDGWIYPNPTVRNPPELFPQKVEHKDRHATMVISKIVGKTLGVAKKARIVCVKMKTAYDIATHLAQWRAVVQDAITKKKNGAKNVIISSSRDFTADVDDFKYFYSEIRDIFQSLKDARIPLVIAGGNNKKKEFQNPPPKIGSVMYDQETAFMFPDLNVIMAGYTFENGAEAVTPSRYANVWAVGKYVEVADGEKGGTVSTAGTSFTAPQISGLLATYLDDQRLSEYWAIGSSAPEAFINIIRQTAKVRDGAPKDARPLAYNLAHHEVCQGNRVFPPAEGCVAPRPGSPTMNWPTIPIAPTPTKTHLPVITDGWGSGDCGADQRKGPVGTNSKPIDKDALQRCLLKLDTSQWLGDSDCEGMVSFRSGHGSWQSAPDCYSACKNCLSQKIEDGFNQMWCNAHSLTAKCWMGYIIVPPPLVTDGWGWGAGGPDKTIRAYGYEGIDGHYIDQYKVQDCIRHMDASQWLEGDKRYNCGDMVRFDMRSLSGWQSPSDCWMAIKNCLSEAVNEGASEAFCEKAAGFTRCIGGFQPR